MSEQIEAKVDKPAEKKENFLLSILLNVIIPTLILTKLSSKEQLGPQLAIVVALAFPVIYGVHDFFRVKKINFFSALGVVSILLTGGMSLLELDAKYIAIKEAAIPGLIGLATLFSLKTRFPLVRTFLYNDKLMQTDKIERVLHEKDRQHDFDATLVNASYMVAGSFFLSSALNYILAKVLLVSPPGSEAYTAELGQMTAYSYIVITIPSMIVLLFAIFYLFRSITRLTELTLEDIFHDPDANK